MRNQGQSIPDVSFAGGKLVWSNTHSGEQVANIGFSFCSSGDHPWFRTSRHISQMHKATDKVLDAGPSEWREKYRSWDFPPKPPGMHWKTYDRLVDRHIWYDAASAAAICERLKLFG